MAEQRHSEKPAKHRAVSAVKGADFATHACYPSSPFRLWSVPTIFSSCARYSKRKHVLIAGAHRAMQPLTDAPFLESPLGVLQIQLIPYRQDATSSSSGLGCRRAWVGRNRSSSNPNNATIAAIAVIGIPGIPGTVPHSLEAQTRPSSPLPGFPRVFACATSWPTTCESGRSARAT